MTWLTFFVFRWHILKNAHSTCKISLTEMLTLQNAGYSWFSQQNKHYPPFSNVLRLFTIVFFVWSINKSRWIITTLKVANFFLVNSRGSLFWTVLEATRQLSYIHSRGATLNQAAAAAACAPLANRNGELRRTLVGIKRVAKIEIWTIFVYRVRQNTLLCLEMYEQ